MDKDYLDLKRASTSRPSREWNDDDFDAVCDGVVVGRIMKAAAAPVGEPWLWTLAFGQHEDRCACGERPGVIPCSNLPQTSNKIIQKGLAFGRKQSGSATVPGA